MRAAKIGFTPLVFAVTKNNVESIHELIAAGADLLTKLISESGSTPKIPSKR